ncbi:MAG: hypothetical protein MUF62_10740 [Chitinophagaceae bacterium]|jgi:hypothetical protein|nr:hypothetical protein [Chitinophagaceae bacterium]
MGQKITCAQAVDYLSKKEEGKLTLRQRYQLWRHLLACSLCRLFRVQTKHLTRSLRQVPPANMPAGDKAALIEKLAAEKNTG